MITVLHGGEGSLGTPKSDYVICARPLKADLQRHPVFIGTRFIVDHIHRPPLLGGNPCLENLNAMADEYTHSMLVTDVDFDVHAPLPILMA